MSRIRLNISWRGALAALFLYAFFLTGVLAGAQHSISQEPNELRPAAAEPPQEEKLLILTKTKEQPKAADMPMAVVYCTHASEEYAGQKRVSGVGGGVQSAAAALVASLEAQGIECIFLQQVFDAPDWNYAYGNSLAALEQVKAEYPQVELFIDVHRDSPVEGLNTHYTNADKDYARMMLIIGSDANLEHPHWEQNRDFAYGVEAWLEQRYPGLMRDARIYSGRYNQHMGTKALLVEIGSAENTVAEAENSAALLGEAIAAMVREYQENSAPTASNMP